MLETESSRQNFDPSIGEKSDSLFYAFGIFEAMQHLADQYVVQGELRGDLVKTTQYTDNNLRQLADFSATTANKYDSAYVYYRVINNCNYYIAHRNTELYTGAENVVVKEYACVKAIRAWAYMQLARNYGKVPFFTEPLTQISQIDDNNFPELDMDGIVAQLAPDLEQYTGLAVPPVYNGANAAGNTNWSFAKTFTARLCFIPVDVVLGDMYLEVGDYHRAASHFVTYLTTVDTEPTSFYEASFSLKGMRGGVTVITEDSPYYSLMTERQTLESEAGTDGWKTPGSWSSFFNQNATNDIISYIPMAASAQNGTTTAVPGFFGVDYYATATETTGLKRSTNNRLPLKSEIQLVPSDTLQALSDSTEYYYYVDYSSSASYDSIQIAKVGDMRLRSVLDNQTTDDNQEMTWITKYDNANIILYRKSTVLLHLAEAFNRLGYYDLAFAILKDGISPALIQSADAADAVPYMSETSKTLLTTTYPLLANTDKFPAKTAIGIHCHGTSKAASDMAKTTYRPGKSPYNLPRMGGIQIAKTEAFLNLAAGTLNTKQDTINAIEDMLCDEYALEFAFEGNRYFDLLRLSNHKNGHAASSSAFNGSPANYGGAYGTKWLQKKLEGRGWDESKRYLPFR